jgi:hypothetical protein
MKQLEYIISKALTRLIEQDANTPEAKGNSSKDPVESPFTPDEEKFLGKFDAYGTTHLGIIYSPSDIGIREFIGRSGADLNISPGVLLNLIRNKVIKIVPYTGYGRNTDYTLELQLSLNDVAGLGAEDAAEKEASSPAADTVGAELPAPEAPAPEIPEEEPTPAPEVAWVVKYGDILKESATVAKRLISEKSTKTETNKIYTEKSRVLKRLPKGYVRQLEHIIEILAKKTKTPYDRSRLIADILDNLQVNFDLSPKHIRQSYEFHKNQKRLQKELDKNK